jgi:large subunit ribosomal protein L25
MEFATLSAKPRIADRKSAAKRVRAGGQIPAVMYGPTLKSTPVAVDPAALVKILQGPNGLNTVIKLKLDGTEGGKGDLLVMVREFTHHPVTRQFLHADFLEVKLEEDIDVEVPFHVTGKPVGLVQGGVLHQIYRKLPISARPDNIPASISVDVTSLAMGMGIKAHELPVKEGVRVRLPAEQTVVAVVAPEKDRTEEAAATPGAAAAAPAAAGAKAGAAAAPAAGAKAGAKTDAKAPAAKTDAKKK